MATDSQFDYDVFLSHSSKDKPAVRELAERLKADRLRVWFDEWIIQPGDMISLKVEEGLEKSQTLVLVMSKNAFNSDWVTLERHTAFFRDPTNQQRRFIPLRLDDCEINELLRQFAYIDWRKKDAKEYRKLLDVCNCPEQRKTIVNLSSTESTSTRPSRVAVQIELDQDFDAFNDEDQRELIEAIKRLLRISREVKVTSKSPGSVVLTLELDLDDARELIRAVYEQQLSKFRVISAKLTRVRSQPEPRPTPNARSARPRWTAPIEHPNGSTVTEWTAGVRRGDPEAASKLWNRYVNRLKGLARRKLEGHPLRSFDEEDVAISAFESFFERAAAGHFSQVRSRDQLWSLLVTIVHRKASDKVRSELSQRRGGGRVLGESAFGDLVGSGDEPHMLAIEDEPTPVEVTMYYDMIQRLFDKLDQPTRSVALMKIEGFSNREIAESLGKSERTIERQLRLIQRIIEEEYSEDD